MEINKKGFARPIIDSKKFGLKEPKRNQCLCYANYQRSAFDFWHDLVAELTAKEYSIGIKLEMPKRVGNFNDSGNRNTNIMCGKGY